MLHLLVHCTATCALVLTIAAPSLAQPLCRPKLSVRNVQFSSTHPETMQRKWTATVMVDATQCAPNSSGYFDLGISRAKENAVEVEFRERFIWLSPSVEIGLDLWADEAVDAYWIDQASPCACAD